MSLAAGGTAGHELTASETVDKFRAICGIEHADSVITAVMDEDVPLHHVIDLLR